MPGRLLLCTDGLWRHLPRAAELRAALRTPSTDLRHDAGTLVECALDAGGQDNVTALLIPAGPLTPA